MGDTGWLLIIAFASLANPIVVVTGVFTGLLIRRWWQVALGSVTAPVAYWIYATGFYPIGNYAPLTSFLALAGVIWTSALLGLKKVLIG